MVFPQFARIQLMVPEKQHTKAEHDFLQKQHAKTEQDFFREDIQEFIKKKDEERKQLKD